MQKQVLTSTECALTNNSALTNNDSTLTNAELDSEVDGLMTESCYWLVTTTIISMLTEHYPSLTFLEPLVIDWPSDGGNYQVIVGVVVKSFNAFDDDDVDRDATVSVPVAELSQGPPAELATLISNCFTDVQHKVETIKRYDLYLNHTSDC